MEILPLISSWFSIMFSITFKCACSQATEEISITNNGSQMFLAEFLLPFLFTFRSFALIEQLINFLCDQLISKMKIKLHEY